MTIYGTRLLWPLDDTPFGVGSLFIIDPLYSLPLVVAAVWALFQRDWSLKVGRITAMALAVSTLYLGWSLVAQQIADRKARTVLMEAGLEADKISIDAHAVQYPVLAHHRHRWKPLLQYLSAAFRRHKRRPNLYPSAARSRWTVSRYDSKWSCSRCFLEGFLPYRER